VTKVKKITVENKTNKTLKLGFGPQFDNGEFFVEIISENAPLINEQFIVKPNTSVSVEVDIIGYNYR